MHGNDDHITCYLQLGTEYAIVLEVQLYSIIWIPELLIKIHLKFLQNFFYVRQYIQGIVKYQLLYGRFILQVVKDV